MLMERKLIITLSGEERNGPNPEYTIIKNAFVFDNLITLSMYNVESIIR